ncbi:MAG: hypothetical protein Q4P78_07590 [Rothia sp. (in: high G+C Gram-positive bacteria)]|uniref:hypothetical protein n=1 Tax=Rothia sp. (in: high G+C Gram-positive bacteria) TaxID=1885016 RepID=UPI0026E0642F|nr:hypothetical protein [Rothia sp. (in: high G+C Gram-positive bacteria)]MDO5751040.1 hypothetical protein [Rothia sp. (in: high G+C Gram-positive bacteria)]
MSSALFRGHTQRHVYTVLLGTTLALPLIPVHATIDEDAYLPSPVAADPMAAPYATPEYVPVSPALSTESLPIEALPENVVLNDSEFIPLSSDSELVIVLDGAQPVEALPDVATPSLRVFDPALSVLNPNIDPESQVTLLGSFRLDEGADLGEYQVLLRQKSADVSAGFTIGTAQVEYAAHSLEIARFTLDIEPGSLDAAENYELILVDSKRRVMDSAPLLVVYSLD